MPTDSGSIPDGGIRKPTTGIVAAGVLVALLAIGVLALAVPTVAASEKKPREVTPTTLWKDFPIEGKVGLPPSAPGTTSAKRSLRSSIGPALASLTVGEQDPGNSPWTLPLIVVVTLMSAMLWFSLIFVWRVSPGKSAQPATRSSDGPAASLLVRNSSNGDAMPAQRVVGGIRYRD